MTRLKKIETAVKGLPPKDLAVFRKWFTHFDAKGWDREAKNGARRGRLGRLTAEVLRWRETLNSAYRRMSKDEPREHEAREWADDTSRDIADAPR